MAIHGKNSVFAVRDASNTWRDMTSYVNDVNLPAKATTADATVFGKGAKTFIGGLLEGQFSIKGFYDSTATSGPDAVFAALLGTQPTTGMTVVGAVTAQSNYGQFIYCPAGSATTAGNMAKWWDGVLTDYTVSAPVGNTVSFTVTGQFSGATTATATMNGGTTTAAYGLQVLNVANSVFFSTAFITGAAGASSFANLIGSTK